MQAYFTAHPEVAVAFSGGVDSAYLLYEARRFARRVKAYFVRTPFQTEQECLQAAQLAKALNVPMETVFLDTLSEEAIRSNPHDRCYHCKHHMFTALQNAIQKDGFSLLIEGTNASDDVSDRPGYRALQELGIPSPLRELGLKKEVIRRRAKDAGIPVWNTPANACLATRIPTGTSITPEDLHRTAQAEAFLSSLGFSNHRVRLWHGSARIQIPESQLPLLLLHRKKIMQELSDKYCAILLDLEVRND